MGASPADPDFLSEHPSELANRQYDVNPRFPVPLRDATDAELDMAASDTDLDTAPSLDFEDDLGIDFDPSLRLASALGEGEENWVGGMFCLDDAPRR